MKQRTIKKPVEVVGIGLHKGVPVKLRLEPLSENSGIVFYRSDKATSIELKPENVVDTRMATVIGNGNVVVSTIEHLMSAVSSFGIDNLRIIVDNDEIPIMDGSGISFSMLLTEAGIEEQNASKKFIKIKKRVEISQDDKLAVVEPSNETIFSFDIDFNHPAIGKQHFDFKFSTSNYIDSISKARTFGFLKEVQYLRSIGLALGGSLENAIVLDDKKILNDSLRFSNEFVRHKVLDAIGDMSLMGHNFIGHYKAFASGHHLNHLLTKEILSNPENYEIVELDVKKEFFVAKAVS
jgi:UDP-3-O-[3-hydroxymyristoyl] N-acetylglucosamine deacetylase